VQGHASDPHHCLAWMACASHAPAQGRQEHAGHPQHVRRLAAGSAHHPGPRAAGRAVAAHTAAPGRPALRGVGACVGRSQGPIAAHHDGPPLEMHNCKHAGRGGGWREMEGVGCGVHGVHAWYTRFGLGRLGKCLHADVGAVV